MIKSLVRLSIALALASSGCASTPIDLASDGGTDARVDTGVDADDGNGPFTTVVDTDLGGVTGGRDDVNGIRYFGSIPYAQPPTLGNRFRPPQPLTAWTTPRPYDPALKACPQLLPFGVNGFPTGTEDCLYLNVVVPYGVPADAPVIVWIHGGGFSISSGEQQDRATDGRRLAADQRAIVVTLNYRLGALGFLAHPALSAEQGGQSGNYGMLDQLAALRWVRRNIAAFGGDPTKITLYGQSAGGMSICALMASPMIQDPLVVPANEQPLFSQAILQSAPCDVPYPSMAEAEATGLAFAAASAIGCTSADPAQVLACLRNPTMVTANEARDTLAMPNDFLRPNGTTERNWGPVLGGDFLPTHPVDRINAGTFLHVPVIAGFTEDEGNTSMHFRLIRSTSSANNILRAVDITTFDTDVNGLFAMGIMPAESAMLAGFGRYQPAQYTDIAVDPMYTPTPPFHTRYEQVLAAIHGDMDLTCPAKRMMRALADQGVPVHAYFYRHDDAPFQLTPTFPLGAFHQSDVQFIFGVHSGGSLLGRDFTPDEDALSTIMRNYVGNFARTADPNGTGLPTWNAYTTVAPEHLVVDTTISTISDPRAAECAIWDGLGRGRIGIP